MTSSAWPASHGMLAFALSEEAAFLSQRVCYIDWPSFHDLLMPVSAIFTGVPALCWSLRRRVRRFYFTRYYASRSRQFQAAY